jgi:hypothetical protein
MKRFMNKKVAAIGLAAGLLLGVGGAAFAYITGGSGTGSGTAAVTPSVPLTGLTASAVLSASGTLTPGGSAVATTVTVTDPYTYSVQFGRIHIAVNTSGTPTWPAGCDISGIPASAWFTVGTDTTSAYTAVPGSGNTYTGPTVTMNDDQTNNQTACLNASIPLTVTLSAS